MSDFFSGNEYVIVKGFEYEYWSEGQYTSNSVFRCLAISADQTDGKIRYCCTFLTVNCNHEIATQKIMIDNFSSHLDLNPGTLELKDSVVQRSYADPLIIKV